MAGVKGRSGRKPLRDEEKRLRIIERAWEVIDETLNDPKVSAREKRKIALELCKKDVPTQLQGALEVKAMGRIKINGNALEVNID